MYEYAAKLLRVVDGDTIDVSIDLGFSISIKQRVRLARINTPETRTKDPIEKAAGIAASEFLKGFLAVNHNSLIIRTQVDKRGKFGRVLGEVFADGYCVNDLMLEKGHAVPYT
jgi:micrococcal nuclease